MRLVVFLLAISIIAWFSFADIFDNIGNLVDRLFYNKIKNLNNNNSNNDNNEEE